MLSNTFIVSELVEILYSFLTWSCVKCVIRYHDQCLVPGNVSYGTTTSASHQTMCHMVPRPVPRTRQCVIWYHDQCISHGNVSHGNMTSAFHLAICHTVPQPVSFTWQCVMRYHDQCNLAICHTVPQLV